MPTLLLATGALALKLPFSSPAPRASSSAAAPLFPAVALAAALSLSLSVQPSFAGIEDIAAKVGSAVPVVDVGSINDNINANIGKTDFQERLAKTQAGLGGLHASQPANAGSSFSLGSPPAQAPGGERRYRRARRPAR